MGAGVPGAVPGSMATRKVGKMAVDTTPECL